VYVFILILVAIVNNCKEMYKYCCFSQLYNFNNNNNNLISIAPYGSNFSGAWNCVICIYTY